MMWRCHMACFSAVICAIAAAAASEPGRLMARVTAERAALYTGIDSPQESAAAWLPLATELEVRGEDDGVSLWIPVLAPDSLSLYIYRDLVKSGLVTADKSQVRAGPSATAVVVGSMNKGDRVETRGVYGDWRRITPPPEVSFWIARDQAEVFVKMSEEELVADLLKRLHAAFSAPDGELSETNAPPAAVETNAPPILEF
ncbi:MAG: SH3 domain-containing protein [Kiritimatiellae bacterium]|nr:SH3 domain-containing protein [Kiritimatiellia bacterium]